jgi:hypothetical protein
MVFVVGGILFLAGVGVVAGILAFAEDRPRTPALPASDNARLAQQPAPKPPPPETAASQPPKKLARPSPDTSPLAPAKPPAPAAVGDLLKKPLITDKDLTYLGAFSMPPRGGGGASTAHTYGGLTHRYVKGELRFLSTSHANDGGQVYEVKFPGLSTAASPPVAKPVSDWADVYSGKRWVDNDGGFSRLDNAVHTYGLYWSEQRKRLYWNYGHWYNASSPSNPALGFSTLDDAAGKATGVGAWRFRDRGEKFVRGGCVEIPQWFADRFTKGKTLGVGFGGYFSITASGSMGPALCAVAHPDPVAVPHKGFLEPVPLLGYPHTPKPPGPPDRCHRNTDYKTEFDGWKPSGGVGYWTWEDQIWGGGTWLDLPEKHAVLFFCVLGHGRVWYEQSVTHAERGKYWCLAYHPRDLAAVAQGHKKQWEIQPAASWEVAFGKGLGPNLSGWEGEPNQMVCGATFDPRDRRLYVLVRNVWRTEVEYYPRVYCWQVK